MPNWLAEPPRSLYIMLLVVAVLPLLAVFFLPGPAAKRDPTRKKPSTKTILLAISALALLILAALRICDMSLESDSEQIERKLREMSDGVREQNSDKIFQHVSDSFRYRTSNKAQLRAIGERALQSGEVNEIPIWDIKVDDVRTEDTTATAIFRLTAKGRSITSGNQFLCRARFVRDPDGQWRLQGFELFLPPGMKDSFLIPGL